MDSQHSGEMRRSARINKDTSMDIKVELPIRRVKTPAEVRREEKGKFEIFEVPDSEEPAGGKETIELGKNTPKEEALNIQLAVALSSDRTMARSGTHDNEASCSSRNETLKPRNKVAYKPPQDLYQEETKTRWSADLHGMSLRERNRVKSRSVGKHSAGNEAITPVESNISCGTKQGKRVGLRERNATAVRISSMTSKKQPPKAPGTGSQEGGAHPSVKRGKKVTPKTVRHSGYFKVMGPSVMPILPTRKRSSSSKGTPGFPDSTATPEAGAASDGSVAMEVNTAPEPNTTPEPNTAPVLNTAPEPNSAPEPNTAPVPNTAPEEGALDQGACGDYEILHEVCNSCGMVIETKQKKKKPIGRRVYVPGRWGGRKKVIKEVSAEGNAIEFYNSNQRIKVGTAFLNMADFRVAAFTEARQKGKEVCSLRGNNRTSCRLRCCTPGCKYFLHVTNNYLRNKLRAAKTGKDHLNRFRMAHEGRLDEAGDAVLMDGYFQVVRCDGHTCGDTAPPQMTRNVIKKSSYGHCHCKAVINREPLTSKQVASILVREMNKRGMSVLDELTPSVATMILQPKFQQQPTNETGVDKDKPALGKRKIKKAINYAKDTIRGTPLEALQGLLWLKKEFKQAHPRNKLKIQWQETADQKNALKSVKFCFGHAVDGYTLLRKHLYLDATFLLGPLKGTLYSVVGADADGSLVVLCGMISGNEASSSWNEMVAFLLEHFPEVTGSEWTWVSDRDKGLANAEHQCGQAHIHHCILHFKRNILNWKGLEKWQRDKILNFAQVAGATTSLVQYQEAVRRLGNDLKEKVEANHPLEHWVATKWPTLSYGVYVSNNVEVFFATLQGFGWKHCTYTELIVKVHNWQVERLLQKKEEYRKLLASGIELPHGITAAGSHAKAHSSSLRVISFRTQMDGTLVTLVNPSLNPPYNQGDVMIRPQGTSECFFEDCNSYELTGIPCYHVACAYKKADGVKFHNLFPPELTCGNSSQFYDRAVEHRRNTYLKEFTVFDLTDEMKKFPVRKPLFTKPLRPGRPREHRFEVGWLSVSQKYRPRKKGAFWATRKWLLSRPGDDALELEAVKLMQEMVNDVIQRLNSTQGDMQRILLADLELLLNKKSKTNRLLELLVYHQEKRRRHQQHVRERAKARRNRPCRPPRTVHRMFHNIELEVVPYVEPHGCLGSSEEEWSTEGHATDEENPPDAPPVRPLDTLGAQEDEDVEGGSPAQHDDGVDVEQGKIMASMQ